MRLLDKMKLNKEIYSTLNSCNPNEFKDLMRRIIDNGDDYLTDAMTSKWFIWNRLRGRDFYRMLSEYVSDEVQRCSELNYDVTEQEVIMLEIGNVLTLIRKTCKNDTIYKNFVHGMNKKCVVLTLDTLPFISDDRIEAIRDGKVNKPMFLDKKLEILMERS